MNVTLQNVVIPARRFDDTVAFYKSVLGLAVLNDGPAYCFFRAGGANIVTHSVDDASDFPPSGRGMYLDLLVDDIVEARRAFEEAKVDILKEWRDHNGEFLLVSDPEGNLVEVYEATA